MAVFFLFLTLASAVSALGALKWQVELAFITEPVQGNFGGLEVASQLCNTNSNKTWYPVLYDANGLNPDIQTMLDGKQNDLFAVRSVAGELISLTGVMGSSLTNLDVYPDGLYSFTSFNGKYPSFPYFWVGDQINHCQNWTTNSSSVQGVDGSLRDDYILSDCNIWNGLICMSQVESIYGISSEPYRMRVALTQSTYPGNLRGYDEADAICASEAGNSDWKAIYTKASDFIHLVMGDVEYTPLNVARIDWVDGTNLIRHTPTNHLSAALREQVFESDIDRRPPVTFSNETLLVNNTAWMGQYIFVSNTVRLCEDFNTTGGVTDGATWTDGRYTLTGAACDESFRLLCHGPLEPNNIETISYAVALSFEQMTTPLGACHEEEGWLPLYVNSSSDIPNPFVYNEPVQFYTERRDAVAEPLEPSLFLNSTSHAGFEFQRFNGSPPPSIPSIWTGSQQTNCHDWTNGTSAARALVIQRNGVESNLIVDACNNYHYVYCVAPLSVIPSIGVTFQMVLIIALSVFLGVMAVLIVLGSFMVRN